MILFNSFVLKITEPQNNTTNVNMSITTVSWILNRHFTDVH